MSETQFLEQLQQGRVLVSDGATGTNLQACGLAKGMPAELWVLEQPERIVQLHRDFIAAGSDIVLTCTFGGTAMRLDNAGLADAMSEINHRAVNLARQAINGNSVLIAGSMGPIGQMLMPLGSIKEEEAVEAYAGQAIVLVEAGVDMLVIETQFDLGEAVAAIKGIRLVSSVPLVCTFSFDRGLRTMMGVRPSQVGTEIAALGVDVIGINCGRSLDENLGALRELRDATKLPIWYKPNAGLPKLDESGNSTYDVTPEMMGKQVPDWIEAGAQIVGGCCGTSPGHLEQISLAVKQYLKGR